MLWAETCRWDYNVIKYKVVSDCIIYILYYILAYIQHNGDVSIKYYKFELCTKQFTWPSVCTLC